MWVCGKPEGFSIYAGFLPEPSPYSFGPEGHAIEDVRQYGTPAEMTSFLPHRPVATHDKYGNETYYSTNGDMIVSISPDGKITFQIQGESLQRDVEGNLSSTSENVRGTNRKEIKNDKGEITGYQEMGLGNKVLRTYDAQGNLTHTYVYDTYGKSVQ